MFFQPCSMNLPFIRPPPRETSSSKKLVGTWSTRRRSGPSPARVSIGAPASTSERTLSGKRAAYIADIQPPWHRPIKFTRPPRSSTQTFISAR
jgi:hypothetical protein